MHEVKSVHDIRKSLDVILHRARSEASFGERLNAQPEETLREAGFHPRAIGEVSQEVRSFAEGKGPKSEVEMARMMRPCDFTTCWTTWCAHWGTFATGK